MTERRPVARLLEGAVTAGLITCLLMAALHVAALQEAAEVLFKPLDDDETPFVEDESFPLLTVQVTPVDGRGLPVRGLDAGDWQLQDDGVPVEALAVEPLTDPQQAVSLLVVLDVSAPMQADLAAAREGLLPLYDLLEQTDESGILAVAGSVDLREPFPQLDPNQERSFTNDEGALINLLNALSSPENSGTPLYDGLLKAIRLTAIQARHPHRAVVLLTNGGDRDAAGRPPGSNAATAEIVAAEAAERGVPLFTIGLGSSVDEAALRSISEYTGGVYTKTGDSAAIATALQETVARLKHSYRLSYNALAQPDNALHNLTVQAGQDNAAATVEYLAPFPAIPVVQGVQVRVGDDEPLPLEAAGPVRGTVILEPQIAARDGVKAVNYYLDDDQVASHVATAPPWSFAWNTTNAAAGQPHTILIEIIDNATPPRVGLYEATLAVEGCPFFCRLQQIVQPFMIIAVVLLLAAIGLGAFLLLRRQTASATPAPPHTGPAPPAVIPPPQPSPIRSGARSSAETVIEEPLKATVLEEPPPSPPAQQPPQAAPAPVKTELLVEPTQNAPRTLAFLIDLDKNERHRLLTVTRLGHGRGCEVRLSGSDVAERHATIRWNGTDYRLTAAALVQVNGRTVTEAGLSNGDKIRIGSRTFLFRKIE